MRKHTFPSELENLTTAQLDQLHQWLDEFPYHIALARLETEFGVHMSTTKLCRYLQKLEFVEAIDGDSETQLQVRDLIDILNGERTPYDEATLAVISKKNFEYLLQQRDITVNKLMLCHRLATYKVSLDITQRRLALNELKKGITPPSPTSSKEPNQYLPSSAPSAVKMAQPKPTQKPRPRTQPVPPPVPLTDVEWSNLLSPAAQPPSDQHRHPPRPTTVRQALSSASGDPAGLTYPVSSFLALPPALSALPSPAELRRLHSLLPAEIVIPAVASFPFAA